MIRLETTRGYDLLDVASALQKTIRRGETKLAGYFAHEIVASGYHKYVWKRLLTISAEDMAEGITKEIKALHDSFQFINEGLAKGKKIKGRIFISKAVIILSEAKKSRDADHMQCLLYDKKIGITNEEILSELEEITEMDKVELPAYTFDVHTKKGKMNGKTKEEFFQEEDGALKPRQVGIFDHLLEKQ